MRLVRGEAVSTKTAAELIVSGARLVAAMRVIGVEPVALIVEELVMALALAHKLPAWDGRGAVVFDFRSGESFPVVVRPGKSSGCRSEPYEAVCSVPGDFGGEFSAPGTTEREAARGLMMAVKYKTQRSLRLYFEGEEPWSGW